MVSGFQFHRRLDRLKNVRGRRVPAGILRSVEAGDAAVVRVDAERELNRIKTITYRERHRVEG
jgi:hypothetical protein